MLKLHILEALITLRWMQAVVLLAGTSYEIPSVWHVAGALYFFGLV